MDINKWVDNINYDEYVIYFFTYNISNCIKLHSK